jgi:hypothetical protein
MAAMTDSGRDVRFLRLARRLDWRFLLPSPELGRVGYLAGADGELVAACRAFARSVEPAEETTGDLDVVVVTSPTPERLERAASLARAGGWVYVETSGLRAQPQWSQAATSPRASAAILRSLGLEDVDVHWHWPDFANCTEIVPLSPPGAARYALGRHRTGARARIRAAAARILLAARMLDRVVPHASVTARVPAAPGVGS